MSMPDNKDLGGQYINESRLGSSPNLEFISKKYNSQIQSTSELLEKKEVLEYHMLLEDVSYQKKIFKLKFTDIASLSGLPISTVKRIIYGVSFPKITTFLKILDAMGLTMKITRK